MSEGQGDLLIIGGGPAGYTAAIRAAQLGRRVTLVEEDKLGGECTNYACIPSKALINVAHHYARGGSLREVGIEISGIKLEWARAQAWKDQVVARLVKGLEYLMSGYGVEVVKGRAQLAGERRATISSERGERKIEFRNAILATGSEPIELPLLRFDGRHVISSKEAVHLAELPRSLLIVGGGAVGIELGTAFSKLGVKVTIVEMMPHILPGFDADLVRVVHDALVASGAEVLTRAQLLSAEFKEGTMAARVQMADGIVERKVDQVLVSVGRRPRVRGLGLQELGVGLSEKGAVKVDRQMRTNLGWLYAAGDVVGPPFLAHKAYAEAHVAAEAASGLPSELGYRALPEVVFSDPEIAKVGMGEEEARAKGHEVITGRYPFSALGRALTEAETQGFAKVVADRTTHRILGVAIVGARASDLIAEAALALELGLTLEDLALVVHAHPTLPEALREAVASAVGMPHHQLRARL